MISCTLSNNKFGRLRDMAVILSIQISEGKVYLFLQLIELVTEAIIMREGNVFIQSASVCLFRL